MEEEKNEKGFVIKDRRLFDESGTARTEADKKEKSKPVQEVKDERQQPQSSQETKQEQPDEPIPEINFVSFIYSLATTAFYHFGDFPDPATNKTARNLPAAKQTIDILNMLRNKTAGNLEEAEKQMLEDILYELQMRYVKETTAK
jgi:PBP1b-binding outer membrane lipoprotein LpoB